MKKIFYLIPLFLYTINLFAQQSLKGTIVDSKHSGIPGVSVFIPDLKAGTTTDDKGNFTLTNLPKTSLNIQFTAVGFKSEVKTVNPESSATIEVSMESSSTELEEVLVTSSNSKLPDNVPFSAISISQSGIRKYGSPSVMGNLSYQPGIDKITIGNGIGKPVIRGLSFNQIMLYSQGTRVENQQWDDHHDLGLSDVGVENVEIIRGPAALIYCADALGGALIFVDEKPAASGTMQSDLNLGFGSNTVGIDGDIGLKSTNKNGFFYGIRLGGASHTSYVQGAGESEANKPAGEAEPVAANSRFMNMLAKVNAGVSKKWGVSKLSYSFFNQQLGIVEDEGAVPDSVKAAENEEEVRFGREMEAPYQDVTSHIISLENTFITGKSKVNLNLSYQVNDRKEFEPEGTNKKPEDAAIGLMLNTTTYDLKWTSNADKKFGVTIGSQGTFLKNENNGKEALVPNADVSDIAGYGLFRLDLDKLNLLGGVRYDMRHIEAESYEKAGAAEEDTFIEIHPSTFSGPGAIDTFPKPETDFKKDYTPVSFSLGACFHAGEHFTLKINGATGFSAPNYAQLGTFGKHEGTYRFERGDADLKVEQNVEGDLGLIWENQFLSFNLGGYMNMVKDYIYIESTNNKMVRITPDGRDTLPGYDYKQRNAILSGLEAGFDIHPSSAKWLDISASYSMMKGTFSGVVNGNKNLPYIPAGKLVGELKLTKSNLWKFTNTYFSCIVSNYSQQDNLSYYEKIDADAAKAEGFNFEGYTLLDIHIGASFKLGKQKASFDFFGTNILNTGYFNQLSLVKYIGVRDMGANFGVRLKVPLCFVSK